MIEIKELAIKYGDFTAVHDLNLSINKGEFFTFLGPSGCGKTTTLRAIAGFEKPAAGSIVAFGENLLTRLPEERNLGFVFQSYALFPTMSVYENIAFGLRAHKTPKKQIDGRVKDVAEKTGITMHLNKKISELSGGQQQRVAIARALVLEPKILLMDEPLSNLDAKLRVSTREEIRKLQRKLGITTIYVTHDQEEAMAISDRIAVFNAGCIEQIGTPKEIYNHPKSAFVAKFIGDINLLEGSCEEAVRQKGPIEAGTRLFIRPHRIKLAQEKAPEDRISLEVRIGTCEFLGVYTKINLITQDGHEITALAFGSEFEYGEGDKVTVSFRLKDVLVLPGE